MPAPLLMGVVNVTPDSFSDGGRWATAEAAVHHGRELLRDGADILDIGGESTRPGATRPLVEDEVGRVVPVIEALVGQGARVSVDTMRSEVAERALEAGAQIVNDVSGGLADPHILDVVAASEATYVCMHWRGHSDHMQELATYDGPGGVVGAVSDELCRRVDAAHAAGIPSERIVLDPGLGFAKRASHNWALLTGLPALAALGFPLLVGPSRKSFLGTLLADRDGTPRPVDQREAATVALTVLLAQEGVWGVRVHDVRASRDALLTLARWDER
jgi:dihydropteroate synthase